jgi:hypothetical protein
MEAYHRTSVRLAARRTAAIHNPDTCPVSLTQHIYNTPAICDTPPPSPSGSNIFI